MARRYEYYFRVVKYCFQLNEKIIFIFSRHRVMFFLLYGQKSEQANRENRNLAGKHARFSRVTFFSYFHLCFSLR